MEEGLGGGGNDTQPATVGLTVGSRRESVVEDPVAEDITHIYYPHQRVISHHVVHVLT